jgi:hypothetical protein
MGEKSDSDAVLKEERMKYLSEAWIEFSCSE